jgi:hypothetical protein
MTCSTAGYFLWRMVSGLPLASVSALSRYAAKEQLSRTFGSLAVPLSTQTMNAFPAVALLFALATVTLGVVSTLAPPRRTTGQVSRTGMVPCRHGTGSGLLVHRLIPRGLQVSLPRGSAAFREH